MSMYLHVLRDSSDRQDPSDKELTHWAITTVSFLEIQNNEQEFTIRIVDKAESARIKCGIESAMFVVF